MCAGRSLTLDCIRETVSSVLSSTALGHGVDLDVANLRSGSLGEPFPGHPDDYLMAQVSWYQERGFWNHQYILITFQGRSSSTSALPTLFVRLERDKTEWIHVWSKNLVHKIQASTYVNALTTESFRIAYYVVHPAVASQSKHANLTFLGELVEAIQGYSSQYAFLSYNCWWFAGCCYDSIARLVKDDYSLVPEALHTRSSEPTPSEAATLFGAEIYFRNQWPYWMLLGYVVVVLMLVSTFFTYWSILAYGVPAFLIGSWTVYYMMVLSSAWRQIRERLGDRSTGVVEQAVSARLATLTLAVSFLFILYGPVFCALAFSPAVAVVHVQGIGDVT